MVPPKPAKSGASNKISKKLGKFTRAVKSTFNEAQEGAPLKRLTAEGWKRRQKKINK